MFKNFFKKTPLPTLNSKTNWGYLKSFFNKNKTFEGEPITFATMRLVGGAKDVGADLARAKYKAHKTRLSNQWINPMQSVNSGFGTAQLSYYNYQTVNYWQCYSLSQDPLFVKVFNLLSDFPFSKGGQLLGANKKIEKLAQDFNVLSILKNAVRSSYVVGGCLVYLDFGLEADALLEPLDLTKINMKSFKGFRHIDPINTAALDVNTVDPSKSDYMTPQVWYITGLGSVHRSHFLHFEANPVELPNKPLTMYFGMPLTQLIKQDVANSNLVSQGVANLINRSRYIYLKADPSDFANDNAEAFRNRLEYISYVQDNFGVMPLKNTEDVLQLTTALTGFSENVELSYLLISAKTDIPYTELMGKSAEGMNATGEGDRKKWYDKCKTIQDTYKKQLLVMFGIVAGTITGKFLEFEDFVFNPMEEVSQKELGENIKLYIESAQNLAGLGADPENLIDWLKSFKEFKLNNIEFDTSAEDTSVEDDGAEDEDAEDTNAEDTSAQDKEDDDKKITNNSFDNLLKLFNFKESDHPRDKDGKFSDKEEDAEDDQEISQILGEEFTGFKGKDAIDKLLKEKCGHIKDAFSREDLGGITLLWGNDKMGLQHIIKRRMETGQNLKELLNNLTDIIQTGNLHFNVKTQRFELSKNKKLVVIAPKFYKKNLQFVLTAFELY